MSGTSGRCCAGACSRSSAHACAKACARCVRMACAWCMHCAHAWRARACTHYAWRSVCIHQRSSRSRGRTAWRCSTRAGSCNAPRSTRCDPSPSPSLTPKLLSPSFSHQASLPHPPLSHLSPKLPSHTHPPHRCFGCRPRSPWPSPCSEIASARHVRLPPPLAMMPLAPMPLLPPLARKAASRGAHGEHAAPLSAPQLARPRPLRSVLGRTSVTRWCNA